MLIGNPIIQKELIQASHRRRTYLLRVGLPALMVVLLVPTVVSVLDRYGQDWRAISQVARPIFMTCAWLELIAFSLIAFAYCTATIHDEWTHKTLEVLCASPLSRMQIVYGKFAAALSKLLMAALALLPVLGVSFHLGRMPREIVLGSFCVIAGSVLLFGAFGLMQAAAIRPLRGAAVGAISVILPYFVIVILLDAFVWVRQPLLEAAIPPRALYLVLSDRAPRGLTTWYFSLLGLAIPSGVSLLALAATPWLFGRSLGRHVGAGPKGGKLRRLRRVLAGRRPRLRRNENPFYWQERGPRTRLLRWAVWLVYGITAIFTVASGLRWDFDFLDEEAFWVLIAVEGLITLTAVAAFYGTYVFAHEKSRRRADALLLTGRSAFGFLWSKIGATYWALRFSIPLVGAACVVMFISLGAHFWRWRDLDDVILALVIVGQALLIGPALGVVIGMVFSVTARSATRAFLGFLGSVVWAIGLGWAFAAVVGLFHIGLGEPGGWFVACLVVNALLVAVPWKWRPWKLGLLLALNVYCFGLAMPTMERLFSGDMEEVMMTVVGSGIAWVMMIGWFCMGVRLFDRGMAGGDTRLWRRRARRDDGVW